MSAVWQPTLGAVLGSGGARFQVWTPAARSVELVIEGRPAIPLQKLDCGCFAAATDLPAGTRYKYRVDGRGPFPDPVSRFQPEGVHGPSEVIDSSFDWTDTNWKGPSARSLVIYELHVGAFTREGTFASAAQKLNAVVELGATAIELMPLADFPGNRGWGYDGVSLFAPARCYGQPNDLRRFVDAAHRLGLAVLVDVVYNHLGPDGNYLAQFSPFYFDTSHETGWGAAPDFDGAHSSHVHQFFIENALHWINEYHVDGLRLDATHAIVDEGKPPFLQVLAERLHSCGEALGRRVLVIAEDERNLASVVKAPGEGGLGMDGVWADDFHHEIRRAWIDETEGYYADYAGSAEEIAATVQKGWFYCGQPTKRNGKPRGTDPAGIPPERFVFCLQNHDQIGNRPFGARLHHQVDLAAYRAASALMLFAPQTPLLFMGQEWAATTPFRYFTDHEPGLGKKVIEGRQREFGHFAAFADPRICRHIPNPQAAETFQGSKLNWSERDREPHAGILRLYRDLLHLRANEAALQGGAHEVEVAARGAVLIRRTPVAGQSVLLAAALEPSLVVRVEDPAWKLVLTTEDEAYASFARRPQIEVDESGIVIFFPCPAAVVFRR